MNLILCCQMSDVAFLSSCTSMPVTILCPSLAFGSSMDHCSVLSSCEADIAVKAKTSKPSYSHELVPQDAAHKYLGHVRCVIVFVFSLVYC